MDQLPLPFQDFPDYARLDLLPHDGIDPALAWLRDGAWPGGRLALYGEAGTGKTHLLHRWAAKAGATLLPGAALDAWTAGPLALDDADQAADEPLLHALNRAQEAGTPVLLAASDSPARWPVALPDLRSRLRATTAIRLLPGDDAFRRTLLARLLSDRQLIVPPHVQDWLLLHLPRSPAALREAAGRLDHAGLAAQRGITRPLAIAALAPLLRADIDCAP